MTYRKAPLSVLGICYDFQLFEVSQKDIDYLFEIMCWSKTNEVHVFSFVAFMFLSEVAPLPIYYLSNYPEATLRVINTVKYHPSDFSLTDLLYLEYGYNEPTGNRGYVELMVNYTLCFINLWEKKVNPTFKREHNLFVPKEFMIKPGVIKVQ